eukprot:TRINITY_DN5026_c0_g1_i2.p1 TRINITY_DN5026_c0_g1~~TRINITY_DN5026_c0_g1_i2.p1  ORF type:complete len:124 (-),score=2.40 TRINITY_DN5026_c0_g1_i2:156-527(-)
MQWMNLSWAATGQIFIFMVMAFAFLADGLTIVSVLAFVMTFILIVLFVIFQPRDGRKSLCRGETVEGIFQLVGIDDDMKYADIRFMWECLDLNLLEITCYRDIDLIQLLALAEVAIEANLEIY